MARVIAIANQKGGVGKTTTAINLSASLAMGGARVLLIDLDPQGNATSGLGLDKNSLNETTYDVLAGSVELGDAIRPTAVDMLFLLPASRDLTGSTVELLETESREHRLKSILAPVRDDWDFVLIDCPPSLGILTLNALTAADSLLVPIQVEYFALEGLGELMETIRRVRGHLNPELRLEGVVLTMVDQRLNLSAQVQENIREHFGSSVFDSVIPRNVRLAESPSFGLPIFLYDPRSSGATGYLRLAREFLKRPGGVPTADAPERTQKYV